MTTPSESTEDDVADIEVFPLGGVPLVSYSDNYRPRSGEDLSRYTMQAMKAMIPTAVHPDAYIPGETP
ncbi:hypothetical protein [Corynebacterium sp. AOP12-C2-36]|uniref:hypothetical protein n=1 Tax=Corynebacterium sp. AOP12-C2-36 TaxID=3457723 RepID=UPI00403474A4